MNWQKGEPTSDGYWWLRAPNLTQRVVRAWQGPHGMIHDYSNDVMVTYGRPFECAGPIAEPLPEPGRVDEVEWIHKRLGQLGIDVRQSKHHIQMHYYLNVLREEIAMTERFLREDGQP